MTTKKAKSTGKTVYFSYRHIGLKFPNFILCPSEERAAETGRLFADGRKRTRARDRRAREEREEAAMPKAILDSITSRKDISRQRRWQLRKQISGRCMICGMPLKTKTHCEVHAKAASIWSMNYLERQAKKKGNRAKK